MKYAEIKKYDIANGPGISATIFFSGCRHKCKGCFNEVAQDFNYGNEFNEAVQNEFVEYCKDPNVTTICILGGEPLQQDLSVLLDLIVEIKEVTDKPIWMWTGYTWEEIITTSDMFLVVKQVDVLVDGKFILEKRDLKLQYKGSSNQRVINIKETLKNNKNIVIAT